MAAAVATLIVAAQHDTQLRQALVRSPEEVARQRQLPELVTRAAALVLRNPRTVESGIWF